MTPLPVLGLVTAEVTPALLRLPCAIRPRSAGISPPNPWRPPAWRRRLPWWWFR